MNGTQVKALSVQRWSRMASRLVTILALAFVVGWTLSRISEAMERSHRPAGFVRGMLQGALMPMAWPNLLVGKDLTIYSLNNTGVSYKLGYTWGVNCAGVVFFGCFFWRLSRWRRERS
nr:hypothetical protein Hi04_10k_c5218_00017 [uncultured bacterium]